MVQPKPTDLKVHKEILLVELIQSQKNNTTFYIYFMLFRTNKR